MDTSAFASTGGQGQTQGQQPVNGTPQLNNGTAPGGVAAMIKAIMDGNDAYKAQAKPVVNVGPGSAIPGAASPTSVGGANGPSPLVPPGTSAPPMPAPPMMPPAATGAAPPPPPGMPMPSGGGMAPQPDQSQMSGINGMPIQSNMNSPFMMGANPIANDPVSQALMSPIPGY